MDPIKRMEIHHDHASSSCNETILHLLCGMQTCLTGSFNFGNVSTQAPSIFQTNYAYPAYSKGCCLNLRNGIWAPLIIDSAPFGRSRNPGTESILWNGISGAGQSSRLMVAGQCYAHGQDLCAKCPKHRWRYR